MTDLTIAEMLATRAHEGQFRRDGVTPYIEHPKAVAARVEDQEAQIVAWLHDVVKDTEITLDDLQQVGFSDNIIEAVKVITKVDGVPYDQYLEGVKANPIARQVKEADMLTNLDDDPTPKQIKKYSKGLGFLRGNE